MGYGSFLDLVGISCFVEQERKPNQKKPIANYLMVITVASISTTQQRVSLQNKGYVRTWSSADFFMCFLRESQSNLDSVSSGIDIPQLEAKAQPHCEK